MTAMRLPCWAVRMWFSNVVLPAPRKPVSTETGTRSAAVIDRSLSTSRQSLLRPLYSRDEFRDDMAMHVGQAAVDAVVAERQPRVVEAEQVQNGGVDVVDLGVILAVGRLIAPFVAGAV